MQSLQPREAQAVISKRAADSGRSRVRWVSASSLGGLLAIAAAVQAQMSLPPCPDPGMCFASQAAKEAWAAARGCIFDEADNANCTVTAEMLAKVWPDADADRLQQFAEALDGKLEEYNLNTPERLSHFFAQVRVETGPSLRLRESMNYDAAGLKKTFSYFRNHPEEAERYGRKPGQAADQEAIANRAYGNRMGNGDIGSGDGWSYRGGGLLQTTGRENYQSLQDAYAAATVSGTIDFIANPDLLAQPEYALASAAHFWTQNNLHLAADAGTDHSNVNSITRVINRHTDSYGDRREFFDTIWSNNVFDGVDCGG